MYSLFRKQVKATSGIMLIMGSIHNTRSGWSCSVTFGKMYPERVRRKIRWAIWLLVAVAAWCFLWLTASST